MIGAVRIVSLAASLLVVLAACGGRTAAGGAAAGKPTAADPSTEKVVNIYNWSDYIDPGALKDFEAQTGIKVNYDVFDSNEVLETKLLAGNTGYDLVVPTANFLERQIQAGVFQKLDKSQIPNLKNVDPDILRRIALHDPGNQYGVNYLWGTSGLGYNVAKIHERMPDAPLDSWRMLYDPAVISKFKDCGVSVFDAPSEVVSTVLIFLGKNANSLSPDDLAQAEKVLLSIRPYLRYVETERYIEDLANGETCLALGWGGDVLQARDRAREAGKGIEIKYSLPREGGIIFFDMLAIPADAPHPQNALTLINYLLQPAVAARNSNLIRYANSIPASRPMLSDSVKNDPNIYPPPDVMAKLVPNLAQPVGYTRLLTRTWTRFKTSQ
ncbi:MAG TPA: polyamine ABC transporter substrate-binding protein [Steroidobacteraceae bacterium]|jgi:putrescine transport system substrate-binding protein|nr:polyamine ABC transporter substrate-binding protein [Steroidobacteraceae bacterium]